MKKSKKRIYCFIIIILTILFSVLLFIEKSFGLIDFEQLIFHIWVPKKVDNGNFLVYGFRFSFLFCLQILLLYLIIKYIFYKETIIIEIKKRKFILNNFFKKYLGLFTLVYFITLILLLNHNLMLFKYLHNSFSQTKIYEQYYVDPKATKITFPKEKNNLIYIVVESLETTDFSIKNGGAREKSLIPELEKLAKNNLNFSNTNNLGGFFNIHGAGYTAGAIVGQNAGIPLKIIGNLEGNTYDKYKYILKNAYSLGMVLENNGYKNYYIMGSDKSFGGRGDFLEQHGNYKIFDFNTALEKEFIEAGYSIDWWGFEDKKLYEYAKLMLNEISQNDEPFNFNLLTVDTHPFDGYLDETCGLDDNKTKYQNVYACASEMLNDFIKWLTKQSFYKNTTIIITGDHLNMVIEGIYEDIPQNYERTIYNSIINSKIKTKCTNNRIFTIFDMYPTTLAALGATIEGEKLGLGTNLFSCEETLAESLGIQEFNDQLSKSSRYYNKCLYYGRC